VVSDNSVKSVSISSTLNGKNTPVDKKNTLVFNQPIQSHVSLLLNVKNYLNNFILVCMNN